MDETVDAFEAAIDTGLVREARRRTLRLRSRPRPPVTVHDGLYPHAARAPALAHRWTVLERHDPARGSARSPITTRQRPSRWETPRPSFRTSLAAGEDALQRVAFEEAAGHLRTALGRPRPDAGRSRLASTGSWRPWVAPSTPSPSRTTLARSGSERPPSPDAAHDPDRLFFADPGLRVHHAADPRRRGVPYARRSPRPARAVRLSPSRQRCSAGERCPPSSSSHRSHPETRCAWPTTPSTWPDVPATVHALVSTLHSRLLLGRTGPGCVGDAEGRRRGGRTDR